MKVQVIVCFAQILVTYSITVPPVWPKKTAINHRQIKESITNDQFKFPSFFPGDQKTQDTHFRQSNNQQVYIYHPQVINKQSSVLDSHKPQSFQVVHFDNKQADVIIQPKIVPYKKPSIRQHLTEVTGNPTNFKSVQNTEELSEHEHPKEIPTRPIYPGEGQWSKFGLKHNPYIKPQHQNTNNEEEDDDEGKPEGYEIYENGEQQFQTANNKFKHNSATFPQRHHPTEDTSSEYEKPEIGFVPEKLYTQVRRTENVEHLPRSAIDSEEEENAERLREVVKDSIIHTVYTEEGYEDSAYDHAGHEKNAENSEGHSELAHGQTASSGRGNSAGKSQFSDEGGRRFGNNSIRKRLRNNENSKNEDFDNSEEYEKTKQQIEDDTETANSDHESKKIIPVKVESPTKEFKKVILKNGDQEEINMEIHTEIKYTPQLKKHKYIKIIPSVTQKPESHRRVKRYDKDKLSRRYVRKKPNYYWKKNKVTTTERTLDSMRRKFENTFKTNTNNKQPIKQSTETSLDKTKVSTSTSSTTTIISATLPPSEPSEEFIDDMKFIEATTKISRHSRPKITPVKVRKLINKREKRYTIDHPNIDIDLNGFIDVEKLAVPTEKPDLTHFKYPYYNLPVSDKLHENSPLRYAEDMKSIPNKVENEMSFYNSRSHIICPEIESDVNPIPDRNNNNQEEEEDGDKMVKTPDLPRLKGLGDKIDCMKEKYFGENPLDSPFFQEENIESPIPLFILKAKNFNEEKTTAKTFINYKQNIDKLSQINVENPLEKNRYTKKRELTIKILEPIVVIDDELFESATMNPIHLNTEAVLKPPYTLQEMMTMNNEKYIKITPKSIYDQITLLEQEDEKSKSEQNTKQSPPTEKFVIIYDNQDIMEMSKIDSLDELQKIKNVSTKKPEEIINKPQIKRIKKKPVKTIRKLTIKAIRKPHIRRTTTLSPTTTSSTTTQIPTTLSTTSESTTASTVKNIQNLDSVPETAQMVQTTTTLPSSTSTIKPISIPSSSPSNLPVFTPNSNWPTLNRRISAYYNIFDITRYLPKVPNHRDITSEVQYKEEIKPSEQMRVYSDVLKTINEARKKTKEESTLETKITEAKQLTPITTSVPSNVQITSTEELQQPSDNIIGLTPPLSSEPYQTMYPYFKDVLLNTPAEEIQIPKSSENLNYYYVIGMQPPQQDKINYRHKRYITKVSSEPIKQLKSQKESEDLMMEESRIVNMYHKINKRSLRTEQEYPEDDLMMSESANRPAYVETPFRKPKVYTEIVRNRPSRPQTEEIEEEEEEEEDLNPRKRIYELKSTLTTSTERYPDEFIEEIIEEEIPVQTEPPTTRKPIIYPVEANSENPNIAQYIAFIEKLKKKWEKEDATSTTTSTEATTTTNNSISKSFMTQIVSEGVNERRGEPAYLQIINQLHEIRKNEEKTSPAPVEQPTEQYQVIPVRNSNPFILESGIDSFMSELHSMQSKFDSDNTAEGSNNPEISTRNRNFSAKIKTSVDTSKYKTIERSPITLRHNFSSRFNAADQELPLNKDQTTKDPMLIAIITTPQETSSMAPSPSPIQTSTETATTTTIRSRQRSRSRTRPTTTPRPATAVTTNSVYRRRRPTKTTTTQATITTTKPESNFSRRRSRPKASEVQSLLPTNDNITETSSEEPKKQRRFQKVQERRVTSEVTLTRFFEPVSDELDDSSEESKKHQYEVIGPLSNTNTGHGGNYHHETDRPHFEDELTTTSDRFSDVVAPPEAFFSDPNLAVNVNQLKEAQDTSTAKSQASNILLTNDEIAEKVTQKPSQSKVSLYPNMARMVNRLAEAKTEEVTMVYHPDNSQSEGIKEKPTFIKDPSRRMYYYAKL